MNEWPPRLGIVTKDAKDWASMAAKIPDHDQREEFILAALEGAYKAGYQAGKAKSLTAHSEAIAADAAATHPIVGREEG